MIEDPAAANSRLRLQTLRRTARRMQAAVLAASAVMLASPVPHALGHPHGAGVPLTHEHQALGLEITVADDGITYEVLLSNGCLNLLIPRERGNLKLSPAGNVLVFDDPEQSRQEHAAFAAFFAENVPPISINHRMVDPVFERVEFLAAVDPTGVVDHRNAPPDARVILHFPSAATPQRVAVTWTLYPPGQAVDAFGQPQVPELAARFDARAESKIITFTGDAPEYVWTAPPDDATALVAAIPVQVTKRQVALPLLSVALVGLGLALPPVWKMLSRARTRGAWLLTAGACVGAYLARAVWVVPIAFPGSATAQPISESAAAEIFRPLLRNVYRAFDYKREADIYDVLAKSVDGAELAKIYGEVYQSLIARDQGGAVARVKEIQFVTVQPQAPAEGRPPDPNRFEVRCRWRVFGLVYHWGHVHERANEYRAEYRVEARDGYWKITHSEVLDQRRLSTFTPDPGDAGAKAGAS
jgi:hypothetical protein